MCLGYIKYSSALVHDNWTAAQIADTFPGTVKCKYPQRKVVDIPALKSTYVVYSPEGLAEPSSAQQLLYCGKMTVIMEKGTWKNRWLLNEAINTDSLNFPGMSLCEVERAYSSNVHALRFCLPFSQSLLCLTRHFLFHPGARLSRLLLDFPILTNVCRKCPQVLCFCYEVRFRTVLSLFDTWREARPHNLLS